MERLGFSLRRIQKIQKVKKSLWSSREIILPRLSARNASLAFDSKRPQSLASPTGISATAVVVAIVAVVTIALVV